MADSPLFLIWSNEHKSFWKPEKHGYTRSMKLAGRYGYTEAMSLAHGDVPELVDLGGGKEPAEVVILAPEYILGQEEKI